MSNIESKYTFNIKSILISISYGKHLNFLLSPRK